MRRLLGWIGGAMGGIAAYRWLRGRPPVTPEPSAEPGPTDERAEELRAKLAESRVAEPVVEETPPEPVEEEEPEPAPAPEPESPEERRTRVHEEGRAALDEMKSDAEG